jgi:hypothetical protein
VRVLARQDGGAAGGAERRGGERVQETRPFSGELIDVRRFDEGMPGDSYVIPPQVVDQYDDNIRWPCAGFRLRSIARGKPGQSNRP